MPSRKTVISPRFTGEGEYSNNSAGRRGAERVRPGKMSLWWGTYGNEPAIFEQSQSPLMMQLFIVYNIYKVYNAGCLLPIYGLPGSAYCYITFLENWIGINKCQCCGVGLSTTLLTWLYQSHISLLVPLQMGKLYMYIVICIYIYIYIYIYIFIERERERERSN